MPDSLLKAVYRMLGFCGDGELLRAVTTSVFFVAALRPLVSRLTEPSTFPF